MAENTLTIDLDQFKLYIHCAGLIDLCLHFDSPSRRFYLSVIALVTSEMKRLNRVVPVSLEAHHEILALLNETVGSSAGSSKKQKLIPRIYKKWKSALPDIENAPLFRIPGKKKSFEESYEKIFSFSDVIKDAWANLFDYKGSNINVRLRFSIDRLDIGLDNVSIIYDEGSTDRDSEVWERFIIDLKQESKSEDSERNELDPVAHRRSEETKKYTWSISLATGIILFIGLVIIIWNLYQRQTQVIQSGSSGITNAHIPETPSIAVLPFQNFSEEPNQEYLVDGLTETLITGLAQIPDFFVVARNSAFKYKGKHVKVQEVTKDLGVQYAVEGSVQKTENQLKITAQLIDGATGGHMWADQYDPDPNKWIAVQDEIILKIINAIQVKLTEGDQARFFAKGTNNVKAYLKYIQGRAISLQYSKAGNIETRKIAKEIIELDPEYSRGYILLAFTHIKDARTGYSDSPEESLAKAELLARKVFKLDDSLAMPHIIIANILMINKIWDDAIAEARLAVSLEASSETMFHLARILHYAGEMEEAIEIITNWLPVDPTPALWVTNILGRSFYFTGQHQKALVQYKRLLGPIKSGELRPASVHLWISAIYVKLGRLEEARRHSSEVLGLLPAFTLEWFGKLLIYSDIVDIGDYFGDLRIAGLK